MVKIIFCKSCLRFMINVFYKLSLSKFIIFNISVQFFKHVLYLNLIWWSDIIPTPLWILILLCLGTVFCMYATELFLIPNSIFLKIACSLILTATMGHLWPLRWINRQKKERTDTVRGAMLKSNGYNSSSNLRRLHDGDAGPVPF